MKVKQFRFVGYIILFIIFCLGNYVFSLVQYKAIQKHYPHMTFLEYLLLEDKIRITPDG